MWVSAPIFVDAIDLARNLRQQETATWILEELQYKKWLLDDLEAAAHSGGFGSNVLWIHGMSSHVLFFSLSPLSDIVHCSKSRIR